MNVKDQVLDSRFLTRSLGLLDPSPALTMHQDEPIIKAIEALKQHKVGCVTVCGNENELVGILSERDLILKVIGTAIKIESEPIKSVMTATPKTAEMTTTLAYALNPMSAGGYRHLPIVTEAGQPIGMVSVKDIIDYIVDELTEDLLAFAPS